MNERDIFLAMLDLSGPTERAAYLDQACGGNAVLREKVEALLRSHEEAGSFLGTPAIAPGGEFDRSALDTGSVTTNYPSTATFGADHRGTVNARDLSAPGMVVGGRYTLVEIIGEGGMGTVWLARQTEPVKRVVAVKLIKSGMDSKAVLARFEAERQALAVMDHPNIAKVLDAGATPEGRPFFVMELVKGIPITKYCDEQKLTPRQRLELFVPVCQAIQHAHQKGVIHRDIKPSNVLIALYDDRAAPKVIDFGVAKAAGSPLTELSVATGFGAVVGTPEYMSPEQASFNNLDIDTRSDVYALGVLLYELLTGSPPFTCKDLEKAGLLEVLRVIREQEPQKPSTKLSTADALPSVSANRGTEPKRLTALMRGELDWIVMKALEKDRARRYESANGFAADVLRYLAGEAVSAHPPSAGYRLRKFLRRNKGSVLAASLVFLVLLAGIAGTTFGLIRADGRRIVAEQARADEAVQRSRAEAKEAETEAVLDFVQKEILAMARPKGQEGGLGRDVTLRDAIDASLLFVDKNFAKQPITEARLRLTLGSTFFYLDEPETARMQYAAALALFEANASPDDKDTLTAMHDLATSYHALGRYVEAINLYEDTFARRKVSLGTDHKDTLMSANNLGSCYFDANRPGDALKLHEETFARRKTKLGPDHRDTLASANNLGTCYTALRRYDDALKIHEETLAVQKIKLPPDHPNTLASMTNVANAYANLNRHREAVGLREETLAIQKSNLGPNHSATLATMNNLAISYRDLGRHLDALKLCEETVVLKTAKLGRDHPDTLMGMLNLAISYTTLDRHAEALNLHKERLALFQVKYGMDDPQTLRALAFVAGAFMRAQQGAEAIPLIDELLRRAPGKQLDPNFIPDLLRLRKQYFTQVNDAAGCLATVEMWEKLALSDGDSLYDAACWRAVTAGAYLKAKPPAADADRLSAEQADLAMSWLRKAVKAGYIDTAHMAKDTDLDPLRTRADFKQLIADIEKQAPPPAKAKPD